MKDSLINAVLVVIFLCFFGIVMLSMEPGRENGGNDLIIPAEALRL